jgi:hypothetical protein
VGIMDIQLTLYNGCNLGLERKRNSPTWINYGEGYGIEYFSGVSINLLCIRILLGTFIDAEELEEELGDP